MTDSINHLDFEQIYVRLSKLADTDINAFEREADRLKDDFINQAPAIYQSDLRRMQNDIDKELSHCKTSEERLSAILKRLTVLRDYTQDVLNGRAPVCVEFPNINLLA